MKNDIIKRSATRPKPVDITLIRQQEEAKRALIENKIRIDELKAKYKREV